MSTTWSSWSPPNTAARPSSLAASSWAAKLAVVYAAQRPASLSGLLLLGPVLTAEVKLSPARQVQVVVGHLVAPMAYLPIPLTPELYTANPPYPGLHPGRSAATAGGHGPVLLGDGPAGPPAPARGEPA